MSRVILDGLVVVYALSLVLLFIDVVQPRRTVNRTALVLLFLVFVAETAVLLVRLRISGSVPVYTPFDVMMLVSWLILLVALVVNAFFRIDLVLFFANTVGFAIVVFDAFAAPNASMYQAREGDILAMHIASAVISYTAFAFAFVFAVMYLVQERFLREKQWNRWYIRLPSLERLDTYGFRSIVVGFPSLLISIMLGVIWGQLTLHRFLLFDPKPIVTCGLWVMYGIYLVLRMRHGFGAQRLIWWNVVCFALLVVNFVVVGNFSVVHPKF
ncbi:cytochrome C assembly family protein [Alicyclobacillus contaminans]|uniref:cytochrome C assembly family protein n=1 Tax=Alicyclobacillus contaminans TaxID=392016 RepID=UPI0003F71769|nr:cytochrome c biogenesis protein CcsA [Alicyclobacillus contaminans]